MLGSNVPTVGGLTKGFYWADKWECECIQIYVTLSRRWDVAPLEQGMVRAFKDAWQKSGVQKVIAHVPFLVNLISPDDELKRKSIERLTIELHHANQLGVNCLVLHPGSSRTVQKSTAITQLILYLTQNKRVKNGSDIFVP